MSSMSSYQIIFLEQSFIVEANDPQEALRAAAYELARQCEGGQLGAVVKPEGARPVFDWPGRIPRTGVNVELAEGSCLHAPAPRS